MHKTAWIFFFPLFFLFLPFFRSPRTDNDLASVAIFEQLCRDRYERVAALADREVAKRKSCFARSFVFYRNYSRRSRGNSSRKGGGESIEFQLLKKRVKARERGPSLFRVRANKRNSGDAIVRGSSSSWFTRERRKGEGEKMEWR